MKIRIMTAAVAAVLSAWSPVGAARDSVALNYTLSTTNTVGIDTTTGGTLTVNPNINISAPSGAAITTYASSTANIVFVGSSTVTGSTGLTGKSFLSIAAGANAATVNFNGDVFATSFNHSGTGTVNLNGNLTGTNYYFNADGFLNIAADKVFTGAITVLPAANNIGTITLNSGAHIEGAIGAASYALNQINLIGDNASINGAIFARDFKILGDGAIITGALAVTNFSLANGNANVIGATSGTNFNLGPNTLSIDGALTLNAGATIATTITSNTVLGQILVGGASNITGAVQVIPTVLGALTISASPPANIYRIVDSASGTAGTVSVLNNNPRYTFAGLPTTIGIVEIQLTGVAPLITLVTAPDALKVAPILDVNAPNGTDLRVVQDAIAVLPNAGAINNSLAQLAPANTNLAAPWVAAQATQLIADTWMARLDEIKNLCCDTTCDASGKKPIPSKTRECKTNEQQSNLWLKGIGKYGQQDDANGMNGYKTDAFGLMLGYDVPVTERTRLGIGAGYVRSNIDGNHSDNQTKIDSYHLTAYFNYAPDAFFVQGAVTAGIDKYDVTRNIVFPGISRQATSDPTGHQYSAIINAGKHFGLNETVITPLVGLKATRLYVESYQESGAGDVNLRVDSQTYDFLQSTVGLKAERIIQTAKGSFVPEVHAKWLHDFNSTTMEQNALFTGGGDKFSIQGIKQDRDMYNVGAGLTLLSCNCDKTSWSVKALYDYKWNQTNYDAHQVSIIAGLNF